MSLLYNCFVNICIFVHKGCKKISLVTKIFVTDFNLPLIVTKKRPKWIKIVCIANNNTKSKRCKNFS